jgi:hypothetical protein
MAYVELDVQNYGTLAVSSTASLTFNGRFNHTESAQLMLVVASPSESRVAFCGVASLAKEVSFLAVRAPTSCRARYCRRM